MISESKLTPCSRILPEKPQVYSGMSQHFMEPEGPLPCSRDPATSPYPEPDRSSLYNSILFLYYLFLILSPHLHLGLPSGLFSSDFPSTSYIQSSLLPANLILLDLITRRAQVMMPLIMQFSPASYYFIPLGSRYSSQHLSSNTLSLCPSFNVRDEISHPYKTTAKMIVLHILLFTFLDSRREDERF
jgi:hypothetical protein